MNNKDYIVYTLEDFLSDDFFVTSIKNPTCESRDFWRNFIESSPTNLSEYYVAKRYIESSNEILPLISDREISRLWDNIAAATDLNKPKHRFKRQYLFYPAAIAASVLLAITGWYLSDDVPSNEICEFASIASLADKNGEARLILSDAKTVVITEPEAEISYNNSKITVSKSEISKEESAKYNQLIIPRGKMSKLTLCDGTKIWVNANTRVIYPVEFASSQREIYVDGEVFLDVVHDNRPFIVKTKNLSIEVLGTRFNVSSCGEKELERIVLVEGSVKVVDNKSKNKTLLAPAQMFESVGGQLRVETVDVRKYASWIDGSYYFDMERLETVAERLSDYYGVRIVCSEQTGDFICSGKLDLKESIDEVLRGLSKVMPVICQSVGDDMHVITVKEK